MKDDVFGRTAGDGEEHLDNSVNKRGFSPLTPQRHTCYIPVKIKSGSYSALQSGVKDE